MIKPKVVKMKGWKKKKERGRPHRQTVGSYITDCDKYFKKRAHIKK
jgi:hypothetical protein